MRLITAIIVLLAGGIASTAAEEQDLKLIDRILRPNMSLINSAQNKQFGATGTLLTRKIPARKWTPDKQPPKSFIARRASLPGQFATRTLGAVDETSNISPKSQLLTDIVFVASATQSTRVAPENGRNLTVAPFPGSRPFSDGGKSQKALSARDTPLTIEQVRELLNKNR